MTSPAWSIVPAESTEAMRSAWSAAEDSGWAAAHAAYLNAAPRPDYDAMAVEVLRYYAGDLATIEDFERMAAALQAYFEGE